MFNIGIVVIGRNEGERLIRCLQSLQDYIQNSVYVDSASSDNSVQTAKNLGAHTLVLDMSTQFTAARARNAGFAELITLYPQTEFVQFVDGDSEIVNNWIAEAAQFLHDNQTIAVVSGILNERFPEKTIYNTLCDLEWKMPKGEVKSCGGNAMMRVSAFRQVNGYLTTLAAGEEPEMCVRLRQNGWKVWHLHHAMMLHDANMTSFKQWWKRTLRGGYAFAEGAFLHGKAPEFHWVAESKRAWLWGFFIPLAIVIAFFIKPVWGLFLSFLYPIQVLRLTHKSKLPFRIAILQAFFLVIGKFAELAGQIKFLLHRFGHKQNKNVACK
jgi:GT2 family glycosyltransferase